jgi:hypothetical protein
VASHQKAKQFFAENALSISEVYLRKWDLEAGWSLEQQIEISNPGGHFCTVNTCTRHLTIQRILPNKRVTGFGDLFAASNTSAMFQRIFAISLFAGTHQGGERRVKTPAKFFERSEFCICGG